MEESKIDELLQLQKEFFLKGNTLNVKQRINKLKQLKLAIKSHEFEICSALYADLGKSEYESYMCEVGLV